MIETILVVPCYNEVKRLDAEAFVGYVDAHPSTAFLFVDDGSSDATAGVLRDVTTRRPAQLSALRLDRNYGKAEAVRRGILLALQLEPRFVGYWDADLATPLEAIERLREELVAQPKAQMTTGARVQLLGRRIRRSALRHYTGRVFATFASLALGIPIYDTQCGAKLLRASFQVIDVFQTPFRSRWIFDVELIERLLRSAQTAPEASTVDELIVEVPLQEWRDVRGSKIRPWNGAFVAVELLLVRWRLRHPPPSPPTAAVTDTNAPHDRRASI